MAKGNPGLPFAKGGIIPRYSSAPSKTITIGIATIRV